MSNTLMIQGTHSDAGKSALVAGLCRVLRRRGLSVAPFKPQNMANNAAVTVDGGEIGRAQAVQAQAAGLEPHTDMNPVLLKPTTDIGSQVIVQGHSIGTFRAAEYHQYKPKALAAVLESHRRLSEQYDVVLVEGAGSPAEINLRDRDIANMGFAEAVDCPVLLIGDIDRGGVFASLIGTLALLSKSERARTRGFIINRFRGDPKLLEPGLTWLNEHTGKPVLGVLPFLHGLHLEAEDSLARSGSDSGGTFRVIVPATPRLANHTDFDPLRLHPQVELRYIGDKQSIPPADLICIGGSKSTRSDLEWLREQGWEAAIARHLRYGGKVIGICGGYQMLGHAVDDPQGLESAPGRTPGLGLLDLETRLEPDKTLRRVRGHLLLENAEVDAYEIHAGVSQGPALSLPLARIEGREEGAISADDQVLGCYLHGLFDHAQALTALLHWAGLEQVEAFDYRDLREAAIDRLADAIEEHLDIETLLELLK